MRRIQRWVRPALMVVAGVAAMATLSGSVPATAHGRATTNGAQAHARATTNGAMAHARATVTVA